MGRISLLRFGAFALVGLVFAGLVYVTLGRTPKSSPGDYGGPFTLQASSGDTLSPFAA